MSGLRRWLLAASIAASVMCVLVPAASAAPLKCGDTVTEDVVLHADLTGCHDSALQVGADGVTIDLNGHTIVGADLDLFAGPGIVASGFDHVTVKNGTIRGFRSGISVSDSRAPRILNVDVVALPNEPGIGGVAVGIQDSPRARIAGDRTSGAEVGILVHGLEPGVEDHAVIVRNAVACGGREALGVSLFQDSFATVAHNTISDCARGGIMDFDSDHTRIVADSISPTPHRSTVRASGSWRAAAPWCCATGLRATSSPGSVS
jgi:nitrous oxidase accessory protein NosD